MTHKYEHLMLDIETLGRDANAVVLTIGAVAFDASRGVEPVGVRVVMSLTAQLADAKVPAFDDNTLEWWAEQSPEARGAMMESLLTTRAQAVANLATLLRYVREHCVSAVKVWGNGSVFDLPPTERLLREHDYIIPWSFRDIRDQRTLADLYPEVDRPFPRVAHDALSDAKAQAAYVSHLLTHHRLRMEEADATRQLDEVCGSWEYGTVRKVELTSDEAGRSVILRVYGHDGVQCNYRGASISEAIAIAHVGRRQ